MTNWDIITLVNLVRNKNLSGEDIRTDEFETLINSQSQLLFAEKLGVPSQYSPNNPIARNGAGVSRTINTELRPFLTVENAVVTGGTVNLASKKIGYMLDIRPTTITGRGFDELTPDEVADRQGDAVVAPTLKDPAYYWITNESIAILPSSLASVTLSYYKYPTDAVVATTVNATTLREEYDSVNSTELDWDDEQKIEIAYRILKDVGINMERGDITQYAQQVVTNE